MNLKLEDVAREAGVSIATVSRVLNNRPVKESTRLNVLEVVARLDYRPNLLARGLVQGKSSRMGVVVSNMENPYFSAIMDSLEFRFREEGIVCNFSSSMERGDEEREILRLFMDSGVDGLVIVDVGPANNNAGLYSELNRHLPVVIVNGDPNQKDLNHIHMDQAYGMELVMDRLLNLNHEKILFVRGKGEIEAFEAKEKVFRRRMTEAFGGVEEGLILDVEEFNHFNCAEETFCLLSAVLSQNDRPTAVFLSNEMMGLGALRAADELNLSIPGDLSLIVHDNTLLSRFSHPPLSTVDLKPRHLGLEAAEMMLQLLNMKERTPRTLVFHPELVIRNSCRELT